MGTPLPLLGPYGHEVEDGDEAHRIQYDER